MLSISPDARDIQGRILTPEDPGYDAARTVFMGDVDRRPALIARPTDAADVARVIALARDSGAELAVRGGGHSPAGHSASDGGVVLDLRGLRELDIDVAGRTAWAGAGLTAGEYTTAAGEHGLATGFGDAGSVGIGGITLSGGVGFLVREHGMTIDQLLAAEIVTADGRVLEVDAERHPDLFWAIRGGGGNFGVVTRLRYRLHDVSEFTGGILVLPASADVLDGFLAEAEAAPDALSTIANVMGAPPMPFLPAEVHGRPIVLAMLAWTGDAAAGERALAPFRALAEPLADMLRPMPYAGMYQPVDPDYHPVAAACTGPRLGRRRGDRRRLGRGRARAGRAAARARRRDGARPGGRDRLRPPRRAHDRQHRRDVLGPGRRPGGRGAGRRARQADLRRRRRLRRLPPRRGRGARARRLPGRRLRAARRGQGRVRPRQRVPAQPERGAGLGAVLPRHWRSVSPGQVVEAGSSTGSASAESSTTTFPFTTV